MRRHLATDACFFRQAGLDERARNGTSAAGRNGTSQGQGGQARRTARVLTAGVRGQVSPCRHVTVSTVSRTNVVQVRPNSPATTASGVASEPACLQRAPVAFSLGLSAAVGHRRHRAGACCSWGAPAKLAPHMRQVRARPVDDEEPNDPAPVQQQRYGECDRQVVARRSGAPAQVCACIYQDWACLCVRATLRRRPKARGVQRREEPRAPSKQVHCPHRADLWDVAV